MAPIVLCVVAVVGLLVAEARQSSLGRWLSKPVASGAFIWVGAAAGATTTPYGRLVLAGLCLCWCGDLLLVPKSRPLAFQGGIAAFLAGHVAYVAAFATRRWNLTVLAAGALVAVWFGRFILRWLRPHLTPEFRVPVRAYVVVICTMAVAALSMTAAGGPVGAAIGALAFVASDLSVARDRFVAPAFVNVAWGLPLYYAAQMLLALTVGQAP